MKVGLVGAELEENLAMRYLDGAVAAAGHSPRIFDFHCPEQAGELAREITAWQPDLVGLSMVFTSRGRQFVELAQRLRQAGYRGHITAGGHFASFHAAELLADFPGLFDSVAHGEGEESLVELLAHLDDPARVAGLTSRDRTGRIVRTARRPNTPDLDLRPWPTRPASFHSYLGQPIANMLASRGCYANCHFCSINAWHRENGGKRFRLRSPQCVAREMAHLYHDRGVRIFNFHDDNFFLPGVRQMAARLDALRQALTGLAVGRIAIQAKARPSDIHPQTLGLFRELGLFRLFLGVENGAEDGLARLGRSVNLEQNHRALQMLGEAGLHVCFNLLIFDPDTTADDLRRNIAFLRQYAAFPLNFCRVEVYAGTEIQHRLRQQGRLLGDYFGHYYRIGDERVQRAFDIFREVFTPRNFTAAGANHQAMRVDYYVHILRRFWPQRAGGGLARKVKTLVRQLNHNNADLMDRILGFSLAHRPDERGQARFIDQLSAERERFDERFTRQVESLLVRMERLARGEARQSRSVLGGMAKTAAAIVLAAAASQADSRPPTEDTEPVHPPLPVPPELVQRVSKFQLFQLRHAQAEEVARILNELAARSNWTAKFVADARTNSVIVMASEDDLAKARLLIAQLDGGRAVTQPTSQPASQPASQPDRPLNPAQTRLIQDYLQGAGMARLHEVASRHNMLGKEVTIRVRVDGSGWVKQAEVTLAAGVRNEEFRTALAREIVGMEIPGVNSPGVATVKVKLVPSKPIDLHPFEMVAPPHMHERVPAPQGPIPQGLGDADGREAVLLADPGQPAPPRIRLGPHMTEMVAPPTEERPPQPPTSQPAGQPASQPATQPDQILNPAQAKAIEDYLAGRGMALLYPVAVKHASLSKVVTITVRVDASGWVKAAEATLPPDAPHQELKKALEQTLVGMEIPDVTQAGSATVKVKLTMPKAPRDPEIFEMAPFPQEER